MKNKKIIFISQPSFLRERQKNQDSHNPDKDIFYIGRGLGHFIAKWLQKKYPDIQIEIWRIDNIVTQQKERSVEGLVGKVYPLKKKGKFTYNIQFFKDLKYELKKNDLIIWYDGLHHFFFMLISFYMKNAYQIVHNLGGDNFTYKYSKTKKIKYKIEEFIESRLFLRNINLGILCTNKEHEYFTKYQKKGKSILSFAVGVNTDRWKIMNQKFARKKLGIPENEKIILQAGRAFKNKGTHITINVWSKLLKEKGIKLYLTGINENDELYPIVKTSGCNYYGEIDHEVFPYWMAAADVYVYPPFDDVTLNFAGIGYSPLEALASGTPIVCTTAHFLDLYGIKTNDYTDIIKIPKNIEEIAQMTEELLESKPSPSRCHNFIENYFTSDVLIGNIIKNIKIDKSEFFINA